MLTIYYYALLIVFHIAISYVIYYTYMYSLRSKHMKKDYSFLYSHCRTDICIHKLVRDWTTHTSCHVPTNYCDDNNNYFSTTDRPQITEPQASELKGVQSINQSIMWSDQTQTFLSQPNWTTKCQTYNLSPLTLHLCTYENPP